MLPLEIILVITELFWMNEKGLDRMSCLGGFLSVHEADTPLDIHLLFFRICLFSVFAEVFLESVSFLAWAPPAL